MCSQVELASKVGITRQGANDFVTRTGIDIKPMTPDEAVIAYCGYLRETAAGRKGAEKGEVFDLATERAKTERLKQDALRLQIAEKSKSLLPVDEIRDGLIPMMQAIRTNVLAIPGKVVQQAKALKAIDLEIEFIEDIVYDALKSCSEIDVSRQLESVVSVASGAETARKNDDNRMGEGVSEDEQ